MNYIQCLVILLLLFVIIAFIFKLGNNIINLFLLIASFIFIFDTWCSRKKLT